MASSTAAPASDALLSGAGFMTSDTTDPNYWRGFSAGLSTGVTQAIPRAGAALAALPELPGAVSELVGLLRGLTPEQRQQLFVVLGIQALAAQTVKSPYERGKWLGAGASQTLRGVKAMKETGALASFLDRLHPPGPTPAGASVEGGTAALDPMVITRPGQKGA